jgi:hypothetical protein
MLLQDSVDIQAQLCQHILNILSIFESTGIAVTRLNVSEQGFSLGWRSELSTAACALAAPTAATKATCAEHSANCWASSSRNPVVDLTHERIKRRPVLGGLINEYERAA